MMVTQNKQDASDISAAIANGECDRYSGEKLRQNASGERISEVIDKAFATSFLIGISTKFSHLDASMKTVTGAKIHEILANS
jgi:hypothetical protein